MLFHILGALTIAAQAVVAGGCMYWLRVSSIEPVRRAVPAAKVMLLDNLSSGTDFVGPI